LCKRALWATIGLYNGISKMKTKLLIGAALGLSLLSLPSVAYTDFVIATGSEGGSYERLGKQLAGSIDKQAKKKKLEIDFEVVNTNGSGENIEMFNDGEAQAAIVQADALSVMPPTVSFKGKNAGSETIWWVYNTKNGYTDIEDIEGKSKKLAMVLVDGSGAVFTMQNFVSEDDGYKRNFDSALYADDLYDAVDMVCSGKSEGKKISGLLYVGKTLPTEVRNDFKNCVSVGEATDGDFDDAKDINGDKLYQDCKIAKNRYAPLSGSNSFSDEKTICVNAMVIYTDEFEDDDKKKMSKAVKKGVNKALRGK
jgi:TRAP-type uncharacterized transport system substrate-binding protein